MSAEMRGCSCMPLEEVVTSLVKAARAEFLGQDERAQLEAEFFSLRQERDYVVHVLEEAALPTIAALSARHDKAGEDAEKMLYSRKPHCRPSRRSAASPRAGSRPWGSALPPRP